jgi:hypothetical protein
MKKVLTVTALATIPAILVALALLALAAGPSPDTASANHAVTIGIDTNPTTTPANTATSLGSIENCRDVSIGQTFTFDLWITNVGHSGTPGLKLFYLPIQYNGAVMRITGVDVIYFLASRGNPVLNASDPSLPDSDGLYAVSAVDISDPGALPNVGNGVLARVTAQGTATGVSQLTIPSLDENGDTLLDEAPFLRDSNEGFIGDTNSDSFYDGPISTATIAVNNTQACNPDWDGDTILNTVDNCPNTANPSQADMDGDGEGDACDLDTDGDGFHNTQETKHVSNPNNAASKIEVCDGVDNDLDTVVDEDGMDHNNNGNYNDAGPDADGDTIKDCLDTTTDTDGDTIVNPSDANDDNPMAGTNDLSTDTEENFMGTDSLDACPDNVNDPAWPVDVNNSKSVNVGDLIAFKPSILSSMGQAKYNRRFDLNASGQVNIGDIIKYSGVILTSCT